MALPKPYSKFGTNYANQTYTDPAQRAVHVADPAHAVLTEGDDPNPVWHAPVLPGLGDGDGQYPGSEWLMTEPGIALDSTPRTHDGGDSQPAHATLQEMQAASGAAHGVDYGGSRAGNWAAPRPQFHDERQVYTYVDGNGPADHIGVDPVALQRGLNSLAENNPEGYRAGVTEWQRADRKFAIGQRVHDLRVLHLNVAEGGGDDVPAKGGRYNSPFDSLARAITNVASRPEVRREPVGIGEATLTDGAFDGSNLAPSASLGEWIVG